MRSTRNDAWMRVVSGVAALVMTAGVMPARANETDQFLLPLDRPFADLGGLVSLTHYRVLERVTQDLNREIQAAQEIVGTAERERRLASLHSPRRVADRVRSHFGPGFFETLGMENSLRSAKAREAFPNQYTAFKRADWIFNFAHLPIDPRNIPLLVQSSTIKVYGHYVGTDKFGHFHDLGHYYFCDYLAKREAGKSEEQAIKEVVATYSRGIISETACIGFLSTGVCSNADLMANYMGLKFYRNVTESIMMQGEEHPPMLVLVGGYWQLNTHVRPESDFFKPFVSDHWNEALNPCVYDWGMRQAIRRRLKKESASILDFYCTADGRPRTSEYFADLAKDLSTYDGEDYGYFGDPGTVMCIANTCFGQTGDEEEVETPPTTAKNGLPGMPAPSSSASAHTVVE